jgi:hypothetical protein
VHRLEDNEFFAFCGKVEADPDVGIDCKVLEKFYATAGPGKLMTLLSRY